MVNHGEEHLLNGAMVVLFRMLYDQIPRNYAPVSVTRDVYNFKSISGELNTMPILDKYFYAYKWRNRLSNYRTALESGNCKIVVIGDSITEGYWGSLRYVNGYPAVLRALLQAKHGDMGNGYINPREERITYTGTWIQSDASIFMYRKIATDGATATITTPPSTSITVIYDEESDGGIFTVSIDGIVHEIYSSGDYRGRRFTVNNLSNSAHTVIITAPTTGKIYFGGLILERSDSGILLHHIGHSGYAPIDLINSSNAEEQFRMCIDDFTPDLIIIAWGDNENERSATEFKADVNAFVSRALTFGDVVLFCESHMSYTTRNSKLYEIVDDNADNVALVDTQKALHDPIANGWWSGGSPGTVGSDPHPSNAGHDRSARVLYGILN